MIHTPLSLLVATHAEEIMASPVPLPRDGAGGGIGPPASGAMENAIHDALRDVPSAPIAGRGGPPRNGLEDAAARRPNVAHDQRMLS
eukprot:2769762-Pyramimonas_sp.AAC.1